MATKKKVTTFYLVETEYNDYFTYDTEADLLEAMESDFEIDDIRSIKLCQLMGEYDVIAESIKLVKK